MKKYWTIIRNEYQRQLANRVDIITYRIGQILELSILIFIWTAVFKKVDVINGYNYVEMMTYVVLGWFALFFTTNYGLENFIAREIRMGTLSNFITKPLSYLRYIVVLAIGRVSIATLTATLTGIILLLFFHGSLLLIVDFKSLIVIIIMLVLGFFIKVFLSVLIGLIAFWTTEVDGINYTFFIAIKLLSGVYLPLDIISNKAVVISSFFPFVYTHFIPIQLYMKKITITQGIVGVAVEIIWIFLLYLAIKLVWRLGLRKYEGVGL